VSTVLAPKLARGLRAILLRSWAVHVAMFPFAIDTLEMYRNRITPLSRPIIVMIVDLRAEFPNAYSRTCHPRRELPGLRAYEAVLFALTINNLQQLLTRSS
jgi:hypothetical protein